MQGVTSANRILYLSWKHISNIIILSTYNNMESANEQLSQQHIIWKILSELLFIIIASRRNAGSNYRRNERRSFIIYISG